MGGKEKNVSGDPQSGIVADTCFSSWPRGRVSVVGTPMAFQRTLRGSQRVLEHVHSVPREREGASWLAESSLGMNCVLVLTPPQAVPPDGRQIRRSQR